MAIELWALLVAGAILRPAGELQIVPSETGKKYVLAHTANPDGNRIEIIQI